MANQQNRPIDLLDHLLRTARVVGKRGQRVFDCVQRPLAASIEFDDYFGPVSGAAPEAMHKNDRGLTHKNAPFR
jgi:hypothetical protein